MFVILSEAINASGYWRIRAATNKYRIALHSARYLRQTQIIPTRVIIVPREWITHEEITFNGVWVQLEVGK